MSIGIELVFLVYLRSRPPFSPSPLSYLELKRANAGALFLHIEACVFVYLKREDVDDSETNVVFARTKKKLYITKFKKKKKSKIK